MGELEMHAISLLAIIPSQQTTIVIAIADLTELECKAMDMTGVAQMHVYWRTFVND
jgi:hypothetical protein